MTSPLQLRYLEEMGIPVWVSRDRVIQDTPAEQSTNTHAPIDSLLHDLNGSVDQPAKNQTVVVDSVSRPVLEKSSGSLPGGSEPLRKPSDEVYPNEIGRTSQHIIYACGDQNAEWMIIGESPEINNDPTDQPYAAEAGVLLCNMLRAVAIPQPKQDAYLINVIPSPNMQSRGTYKQSGSAKGEYRQLIMDKINQVKPNIILVVGQIAAQVLLKSDEPLARLRAKVHILPDTDFSVVVTYYPGYLLSKPSDKGKAWQDLKLAKRIINTPDI